MSSEFQHGICGCFDDCKVCCCSYCCPCIVMGKIGEKVGESCIMCGLASFIPILDCICLAQLRTKVREQKGIAGGFCNDLICACICPVCVMAQAANEVGAMDSMAQSMARE